jgi:hypothetical protein
VTGEAAFLDEMVRLHFEMGGGTASGRDAIRAVNDRLRKRVADAVVYQNACASAGACVIDLR